MDYNMLKTFIELYGINTVISAVIVAVTVLTAEKVFGAKMPNKLRNCLPTVLSLICCFVSDYFVKQAFALEDYIFGALLCVSLSTAIAAIVKKIARGENVAADVFALIVENIISGYVKEDNKTAVALSIASLLKNRSNETAEEKKPQILTILKNNSTTSTIDCELSEVVDKIMLAELPRNK